MCKVLIRDVPRIVSNNVNACHANVINYFPYNVGDQQCALDYLRNKMILLNKCFRNA